MIQDKYTVAELAEKLKLSERTILREIKRGKLNPDKAGRRYVFDEAEVNRYLGKSKEDNADSKINNYLEAKKTNMIDMLHRLVSVPSYASDNQKKQDIVKLIDSNFSENSVRSVVYDENHTYAVKATAGFHQDGFLLTTPVSVHAVGNRNNWDHAPFEGMIDNGNMYGRGTLTKANAVSMYFALLALKKFVNEDKYRLEVLFDTQDEMGIMNGMKNVLATSLDVQAAVVGHTNNRSNVAVGGMGSFRYEIIARSEINKSVNAASKLAELVRYLEEVSFPEPTNNRFKEAEISLISLDSGVNTIAGPDTASAIVEIIVPPSVNKAIVEEIIQGIIDINSSNNIAFTKKLIDAQEGYLLDENTRIVQIIKSSIESVEGGKTSLSVSKRNNTSNLLYANNIPAVAYGITGGNEFYYDEYVDLNTIVNTAKVYANSVLMWFKL